MEINKYLEKDEGESMLKTALTFSEDYDLNSYDPSSGPPACGDDFLQYVMYESSRCPQVISVTPSERSKLKIQNECTIELPTVESSCVDTPPNLIAPIEWQHIQEEEFEQLRKKIEKLRTSISSAQIKQGKKFPRISNGSDAIVTFIQNQEPLLTTVIKLSQPDIIAYLESLLELIEEIPNGNTMPRCIAVWLYSILALVHTPLSGNTYFTLRQISRKCIELRASLPENKHDDVHVAPFKLFICLVGRSFGQIDLADGYDGNV